MFCNTLIKESAEIRLRADCLDTRMQLPSQMLLASYSHPLCSVRTECRMNIQQLQFVELVCLPLIVL